MNLKMKATYLSELHSVISQWLHLAPSISTYANCPVVRHKSASLKGPVQFVIRGRFLRLCSIRVVLDWSRHDTLPAVVTPTRRAVAACAIAEPLSDGVPCINSYVKYMENYTGPKD
jgi:hypothetical protein